MQLCQVRSQEPWHQPYANQCDCAPAHQALLKVTLKIFGVTSI